MLGLVERTFMWATRALLVIAGVIAGLFVARDAPHFGIVKLAALLGLIAIGVTLLATWPRVAARFWKKR